ncbi:MAG: iron chelate uptake ABC transporter family permease subunit [Chloroflexota bacterium]|nr:iron ABC transporter permease [Anaerolineales bacterium]MCB8965841.1 iron ABC transporter permease [Ardenticatenaceae bacterium]
MRKIGNHPYLWSVILLVLSLTASVALGSVFIHPFTMLRIFSAQLPWLNISPDWPDSFVTILFKVRLPHTVLIALTGAALSGSGAAYQGLFRNPLADPYLIGVASGAGLGAVLMMAWRWPQDWLGFYAIPVAAFVGATATVFLVYSMARINQTVPTTTLILAGVAVSSFATALTSFLMLRSNQELRRALGWLLGGSILSGWDPVVAVLPYIVLGLGLLLTSGHALNVLQFGEEQAKQLGMSVERTKLLLILTASLTTAAAVAFSGIIGFIGLIVPHLVRILWGPDYKRLLPLSILGGGSALLLADLLARVLLAPQTLPVGVVTSLAGAPFFLWILRRAKAQAYW